MATSIVIRTDMQGYVEYMKRLGSKRFYNTALRGAREGAKRGMVTIRNSFAKIPKASLNGRGNPVNTGEYKRGWTWEATPDGARIFNRTLYASVIEEGRTRGERQPPVRVIARWAQVKLKMSEKEARNVAFVIARAISRRGLFPRRVMNFSLGQIIADYMILLEREFIKELSKP